MTDLKLFLIRVSMMKLKYSWFVIKTTSQTLTTKMVNQLQFHLVVLVSQMSLVTFLTVRGYALLGGPLVELRAGLLFFAFRTNQANHSRASVNP